MKNLGMDDIPEELESEVLNFLKYNFEPGMIVINEVGRLGEITRITQTKKFIHVDFKTYKQRYNYKGQRYNGNYIESIRPATEEDIREIKEREIILTCKRKLKNCQLTFDEALAILKIIDKKSVDELYNYVI